MSWSKLWYILTIFSIAGLILVTGYFIGNRSWVINKPDNISIVGANNAQINSLNEIRFKPLKARINPTTLVNVGDLMYYGTKDGKTDILVRVNALPVAFGTGTEAVPFAKEYEILLGKITLNGLSYETEVVGKIAMNETKNNQYSGNFFTTLNYTVDQFENKFSRVIFVNNAVPKLPPYDNAIFPSEYRKNPSPFFWTE